MKRPDYFDFDGVGDEPEVAIEVRNDSNEKSSHDDREHPSRSESDGDGSGRSQELAITVVEKSSSSRETAVKVAGSTWTFDDLLCGIATGGHTTSLGLSQTPTQKASVPSTEKALREMQDDYEVFDTVGCDACGPRSRKAAIATDIPTSGKEPFGISTTNAIRSLADW